jgi:hypothetical protein
MRSKNFYSFSLLVIFLLTLQTNTTLGHKTISNDKPLIPYIDFTINDILFDGEHEETGFESIITTTASEYSLTIYFRHNGENLHVVITTDNYGWIAIGWHNKIPPSTTGAGIMNEANIIIGSNETIRDDTGKIGTHVADTTNNIINSSVIADNTQTTLEFLFPLSSSDIDDQPLTIKSYGYFIFATGETYNVDDGHDGMNNALYLPNVYIQSNDKESYVIPSTPFTDPISIIFTLGSVALLYRLKHKLFIK